MKFVWFPQVFRLHAAFPEGFEAIAWLNGAGWLTLNWKFEAPFQDVGDSIPGCVCRATITPGSIVASTSSVTYPRAGPSICDKIFRVTPGVAAGWVPSADASVAINSVIPQIAHAPKLRNLV